MLSYKVPWFVGRHRAVQASQVAGVRSYHRRLFANWGAALDGSTRSRDDSSPSYLLWDEIDAPAAGCAQATFNLHVVTQLGWPGAIVTLVVLAATRDYMFNMWSSHLCI
eukprot:COSAG02_NODE_6005_length_3880_cov_8.950993_3_plen_109_part_00